MWDPGEYRKCGIPASTGNVGLGRVPERWDQGEYWKGGIRQVPKRWDLGRYLKGGIWASTGNVGSWRVLERWDPGEYRKCGILVSIEKVGSGQVPERWDPDEMLENPKQVKRSKQTQGKGVGLSMTFRVCQQMTRISQKSNTIMTKEVGMP